MDRLLCPWDSPGKNTGVGCHFLLQGIFLTQGWNQCLLHWQADSLPLSHQGSLSQSLKWSFSVVSDSLRPPRTDYSLPGFSVHGIFQVRILEWVAISFSRRSSRPREWTRVSHIVGRHFTVWTTREVPIPGPNHNVPSASWWVAVSGWKV